MFKTRFLILLLVSYRYNSCYLCPTSTHPRGGGCPPDLKERGGIPFLKELGPVAIPELMYTFLDPFYINYFISRNIKLTVLRAPWTISNIIQDLGFSGWVHLGLKFSLKYFHCVSRNLKSRKLFFCI